MANFRCPPEPVAEGSNAGNTAGRARVRRIRSYSFRPRDDVLAMSKARREKLVEEKTEWKKNSKMLMYVYVGGLSTDTTEHDIRTHFGDCGPLGQIIIRQGVCHEEDDLTLNSATVEFRDSQSYGFALRRNGTELNGQKITVGLSALDLPDSIRIEEKFTKEPRMPSDQSRRPLRPLRRVPTEIIDSSPPSIAKVPTLPSCESPSPSNHTNYLHCIGGGAGAKFGVGSRVRVSTPFWK